MYKILILFKNRAGFKKLLTNISELQNIYNEMKITVVTNETNSDNESENITEEITNIEMTENQYKNLKMLFKQIRNRFLI